MVGKEHDGDDLVYLMLACVATISFWLSKLVPVDVGLSVVVLLSLF